MLQFVPLGSEETAPETKLQFVPLGAEPPERRVPPEVQAERDRESIAYLEAERQKNLEAGDTVAAEANAREIERRQKTAAPTGLLRFVPLGKEAKPEEKYAAPVARGPGFMLRPEFVEEVRASFGNLPPEQRRAALEQVAAGTGVRAQAALRILEQVKAEDERRMIDNIGRERMVKLLSGAEKKPSFGKIGAGAPVQFPDVAPTIAEEADRLQVPEQERVRRRLAQDEAQRALVAAASTPEAVVEREMDRQRGESQFLSELGRGAMRAVTADLPSMWESAGLLKDVGAAATLNQRLNLFDRIDRGEITSPDQLRGLDISNSQARAYLSSPESREKMRTRIVDQIADRKDLVNTAIKTIEQYQLDAQQYRPLVDKPRNIGSTEDFVNWLGSTIGSGAVQTAPLLLAAAATGGVGLVTGSAIMGTAEAVGERLKYIQDKTKGLPKEQKADAIIEYLQKTGDTTLLAGIVSGTLDAVLGPEARMLKLRAKEIAKEATRMQAFKRELKEVPRQLGEEGVTGALQQAVQIAAGVQLKEKPEFWTKENLIDIAESGLTEATGSLGPAGVTTAIGTARTPAAARREAPPPAAPPQAPLSDEDKTTLLNFAQQRLAELEEKASGTEDKTIRTPDGKTVKIPGKGKQFLSPDEKEELAFLRGNAANADALSSVYEITKEEPAAPPAAPTKEETDTERRVQQALRDLEETAGIKPEGEQVGTEAPEAVQAEAQRQEEPAAAVTEPPTEPMEIEPLPEQLAGERKPMAPEDQAALDEANKKLDELEADVRKMQRQRGGSLWNSLKGRLPESDLVDLGEADRLRFLKAGKDKPTVSIADMVADGTLDPYLPYDMRSDSERFDAQESEEYIKEQVRASNYKTFEYQMSLRNLLDASEQLDRLIRKELNLDEINAEIQAAIDEQREADRALEEPAPARETEAAGRGEEEGFLNAPTEAELRAQDERLRREAEEEARREAAPPPEEFTLTGSKRAADEAAARGQRELGEGGEGPTLLSFSRSETGESSSRKPSVKRTAKVLKRRLEAGKITDDQFIVGVNRALDLDDSLREAETPTDRERGSYWIRQRLLEAVRKGWISEDAMELAEWFIKQNPALVDDLAISLKSKGPEGAAGQYLQMPRILLLIKNRGDDRTVVHEILHHLERMMPAPVQQAIRKAWLKSLMKASREAKDPNTKLYYYALLDHHFRGGFVNVDKMPAELRKAYFDALSKMDTDSPYVDGDKLAFSLLNTGAVDSSHYQHFNPSEFWAVNASEIMQGRFDAIQGGVLTRLKNWLRELGEKIKGVFGLKSEAPLIRALDSLMKGDGKFVSKNLLAEGKDFFSVAPQQPQRPSGAVATRGPAQTGVKRQRDSWMVARDEVGRLSFGPGAKAYDAVARVANAVLDKAALKPISPELGRSIRNMKAEVNKVQNQIVGVAKELEKLSPQEREMISDVIEGELQAGVHPPQHVLNIAASMQEIMTRQSQELVRLGMLSPEAARRWENKYLPRFYMNKLRDDVTAWAKAAKRLMARQPMMRGVKGSQLKARGIFEEIYADQLQDWIDAGWEQRDPNFDPARSEKTVVWRDYTREERENMGEIRDAMFRFVMGYNASQRDVALGRLYENLADNYASSIPQEGYVLVPDTKVEGTKAYRYGKLAGLYVPKEVMDHLAHNDQSVAEGVLKLYRAGLSKWKEGKTVLNPVAHANNVLSNLTMAHFAGVSYWDGQKYAGAVKDIVTNDDMLKEAKDIGLFMGTFNQAELVESMPPQLRAMANMTESKIAKLGDRLWDTLTFTVSYGGKKYGARPIMQWMYENEDLFFRYLIYRDARKRGMEPEDAREYSQQFIFTYDDLPKGARILRDAAMPFFSYTYKIVPVLARTALEYPWRFAAPATAVYAANALMYSIAAGLGGDEDDWWAKTLYKYATDADFRKKVKEFEEEERKKLPPWMKGKTALGTEKAIRLGMDEVTGMPLFLDMSRIFPGGDLFDAESNAGGVALLQPLTPSNPVLTTLVAMLANKDMFFGKEVTKASDTDAEKAQKRAAWLWKQWAPAISVGNYHFDRGMNVIANVTQKPITIDAGPLGTVDYTGVGKDGLPVQPKYAAMQTFGIKVRPYDLEVSEAIERSKQNALIREIAIEVSRINRLERKGAMSGEAADLMRERLKEKQDLLKSGLTVEGEEKK